MDLDHYRIVSMKAVSEEKGLIVGFALTHCIQRHNLGSILDYTNPTYLQKHSDLLIQSWTINYSIVSHLPFKGARTEGGETWGRYQKINHRSVCKGFLDTLHCVKHWDICQYISGTPPHNLSQREPLQYSEQSHSKVSCPQKPSLLPVVLWCLHGSELPGLGQFHISHMKSQYTHLSKMLHFSFIFGAWLHKPEEFGVICFGGQALAPQMFPFL